MLKAISAALAAACLLSGCALLPNYAGVEAEHQSHISQHFGPDETDYGSELINGVLEWSKPGGGAYLDLSEGIDLDPRWTNNGMRGCGEVLGPCEQTQIRFGWRWRVPNG